MQHTKGKWDVAPSGHKDFGLCIQAEDGGSVCHITQWRNSEANAKLIAAAPEMLESLIEAEKHHRGGHSEIGILIREAIKNATA